MTTIERLRADALALAEALAELDTVPTEHAESVTGRALHLLTHIVLNAKRSQNAIARHAECRAIDSQT